MDVTALLSPAGVPRELLRAVGRAGLRPMPDGPGSVVAEDIDAALGQLAGVSLLTFSLDDSAVIAHRLTMRVAIERLTASGDLPRVATVAADLLQHVSASLDQPWQYRSTARDAVEQSWRHYTIRSAAMALRTTPG